MGKDARNYPHLHGNGDVAVSRYFALYLAQAGWLALGAYLFANAYWPSTCRPDNFLEVYQCSIKLADNRGWVRWSRKVPGGNPALSDAGAQRGVHARQTLARAAFLTRSSSSTSEHDKVSA